MSGSKGSPSLVGKYCASQQTKCEQGLQIGRKLLLKGLGAVRGEVEKTYIYRYLGTGFMLNN